MPSAPTGESGGHPSGALPQHQPGDRARARAERHAHAELPLPCGGDAGEHRIHADRREQQRQRAERRHEQHRELPAARALRRRTARNVIARCSASPRSIAASSRSTGLTQRQRVAARAQHEGREAARTLPARSVQPSAPRPAGRDRCARRRRCRPLRSAARAGSDRGECARQARRLAASSGAPCSR